MARWRVFLLRPESAPLALGSGSGRRSSWGRSIWSRRRGRRTNRRTRRLSMGVGVSREGDEVHEGLMGRRGYLGGMIGERVKGE